MSTRLTAMRDGVQTGPQGRPHGATTSTMLAAGVAAGPLFVVVSTLQVALRDGFDLTRHPLSLLALGNHGWIQVANFVVSGLLCLACAVGMRRVLHHGRAGTWGPLLIAGYGVGLVMGGVFRADPSVGFPAGAPAGTPDTISVHAQLHGVGAMVAFLSVSVACLVLARRFAGVRQRGWAWYSTVSGLLAPALVGLPTQALLGVRFAAAAAVTFAWLAVVAAHLRRSCSQ